MTETTDKTMDITTLEKLKQSDKGRLVYNKTNLKDLSDIQKCISKWIVSVPKITSPVTCGHMCLPQWTQYRSTNHIDSFDNSDAQPPFNTSSGSDDHDLSHDNTDQSSSVKQKAANDFHDIKNRYIQSRLESVDYLQTKKDVADLQTSWSSKAKFAMDERRQLFNEKDELINKRIQAQLRNLEMFESDRRRARWSNVNELNLQDDIDLKKKTEELKELHLNRRLAVEGKFKEAENRRIKLQESAKQAERESQEQQRLLEASATELAKKCEVLQDAYSTFELKDYLPSSCQKIPELVGSILRKSSDMMKKAQILGASPVYNEKMKVLFQQANSATDILNSSKVEAERQARADKAAADEAEKEKEKQQKVTIPKEVITTHLTDDVNVAAGLDAFHEYTRLLKKLTDLEASLQPFIKDSTHTKYRFSLQTAVNIPLNAISAISGQHLRDKLHRLRSLLNGQTVDVGGKTISAKSHPQGVDFCKNLLAKMIVKKGEEQVTSKHETAFPIAMVTVGLCSEFIDVKDLLLAHFYRECPYLVPYYIGKEDWQNEEEYFKVCGYKYEDGKIETQDKFLKRISGYMNLYAALMITQPPANTPHVFDLQNAWLWLTRTLNLDPVPDVTVTLMFDILQVCGSALFASYQRQFSKLLRLLLQEYMKKVESVVISGGPVSRLRVFLQECVTSGQIPYPDGYLRPNFWTT